MRFAYEEAERLLDQFAAGPRFAAFKRAYRKFKHMVFAYAYIDYMDGTRPLDAEVMKDAMAHAWEDAQMAFVGHGESAITGAVLGLWGALDPKEHDLFFETVQEAFQRAETATPKDTTRMYLTKHRCKKPRRPEQGFDLTIYLPTSGVKLRDWAEDNGKNPEEEEEQWAWLELADRLPHGVKPPEKKGAAPSAESNVVPVRRGPRLRLVKSDDDD